MKLKLPASLVDALAQQIKQLYTVHTVPTVRDSERWNKQRNDDDEKEKPTSDWAIKEIDE